MIDYFKVLNLSEDATKEDVKRAYRELAKKWHPDRSPSPRASEVFILVNEAYQYLIDDERRNAYRPSVRASARRANQKQREERYKEWVASQQYRARQQAAQQARNSYDEFVNSPLYRTAMAMNRAYDYVFLVLAAVICITPVVVLFSPPENGKQRESIEYLTMGMTFLMGGVFIYFIWNNLIKRDKED